mmetsp:Transcript_61287/g.145933  ORF Transcript_61287/g.145933 Transcript_61287/m.145933 type:complete len:233 (-) Transcript_61287:193-891(-)
MGEQLIAAAQRGDVDEVRQLLNQAAPDEAAKLLQSCDDKGYTALHWAAQFDEVECITSMLKVQIPAEAEPWVLQRTNSGQTPLHIAAENGALKVLRSFLQASDVGADVLSKALLSKAEWGATPLHLASATGDTEAVQALLELRASPDEQDAYRRTALQVAKQNGEAAVIEILSPVTTVAAAADEEDGGLMMPTASLGVHERVVAEDLHAELLQKATITGKPQSPTKKQDGSG